MDWFSLGFFLITEAKRKMTKFTLTKLKILTYTSLRSFNVINITWKCNRSIQSILTKI